MLLSQGKKTSPNLHLKIWLLSRNLKMRRFRHKKSLVSHKCSNSIVPRKPRRCNLVKVCRILTVLDNQKLIVCNHSHQKTLLSVREASSKSLEINLKARWERLENSISKHQKAKFPQVHFAQVHPIKIVAQWPSLKLPKRQV